MFLLHLFARWLRVSLGVTSQILFIATLLLCLVRAVTFTAVESFTFGGLDVPSLAVADRAVFLEKGQVRFSGPAQELLERGDLARAVFLGGEGG